MNSCASFTVTKRFLREVQKVGYTFQYGLDNQPYGLVKIGYEYHEDDGTGLLSSDFYEEDINKAF